MFPSACSLRSTQCAALIALATAAGISRFDAPAENNPSQDLNAPGATTTVTVSVANTYFRFVQAFAPWLKLFGFESEQHGQTAEVAAIGPDCAKDHARAEVTRTTLPACREFASASPVQSLTSLALGPSARQHSFPFAVGPPTGLRNSHRPVAGTFVPCDSATSSVAVPAAPRIARLFSVSSVARLARGKFPAEASLARPRFGPAVLRDATASLSAGLSAVAFSAARAPAPSAVLPLVL